MYLLIDTSTSECHLTLLTPTDHYSYSYDAGRTLARHLLGWIHEALVQHGVQLSELRGIGIFRGPGSFTGLRIGMSVANTIADTYGISIVGGEGDAWHEQVCTRLDNGESDKVVLPLYGRDARITAPKK